MPALDIPLSGNFRQFHASAAAMAGNLSSYSLRSLCLPDDFLKFPYHPPGNIESEMAEIVSLLPWLIS